MADGFNKPSLEWMYYNIKKNNDVAISNYFDKYPEIINSYDIHGNNAIYSACKNNRKDILKYLMHNGGSQNHLPYLNNLSIGPIIKQWIFSKGRKIYESEINYLLNKYPALIFKNHSLDGTPMQQAFRISRFDLIHCLLENGAIMENKYGINVIGEFFKNCMVRYLEQNKPEEIIILTKKMMNASKSEWYTINQNKLCALDYIQFNKNLCFNHKTHYIYDELCRLMSMTRNEWKKESIWKKRFLLIGFRKIERKNQYRSM